MLYISLIVLSVLFTKLITKVLESSKKLHNARIISKYYKNGFHYFYISCNNKCYKVQVTLDAYVTYKNGQEILFLI